MCYSLFSFKCEKHALFLTLFNVLPSMVYKSRAIKLAITCKNKNQNINELTKILFFSITFMFCTDLLTQNNCFLKWFLISFIDYEFEREIFCCRIFDVYKEFFFRFHLLNYLFLDLFFGSVCSVKMLEK